jgi:hypothetical protein
VLGVSSQQNELSCIYVLGVSSQESELSCIYVFGVSSQESELSCIIYMTAHFPGLIHLTHIHDSSLSWLDTPNPSIQHILSSSVGPPNTKKNEESELSCICVRCIKPGK